MKKLFALLVLVVAVVMTSCEKEADFGYPQSVNFTKDGGEKLITGTTNFTGAYIHDYKSGEDGAFVPHEDDIECQVYKWLTIEYLANSTELKIIAEPNTSGKSRKLHIELHLRQEYQVVEVKQK
ncbi:MAG: BACON domain-containing protein [Alistipes sp.]|nr:BACON domain-containing protein [Alistipes sp.]